MNAVHAGGLGGTYGGNPVACAAALAAIDTMRQRDLAAAARAIEHQAMPRLCALVDRQAGLGDVRGRGAMLALEFVRPGTGEPDAARAGRVAKTCHEAGVLVLVCGTYGNVIRLLPPLTIPDPLLEEGLGVLEHVLATA